MSDYFVDSDDVLENKLNISDPDKLKLIEQEIVTNKSLVVLDEIPQTFDLEYLLHIHEILFEDIYDFAGKIRTVNISKPDASAPFAYTQFLEAESKRIFDTLAIKNYLVGLNTQNFVSEIAILSAELNALHPFRDGNGRAIRIFLIMLADHAGYLLDYSQVSATDIIEADKNAFDGEMEPLFALYTKVVQK